MSHDPHKNIARQARFDGVPEGTDINPEGFRQYHQARLVMQSPEDRVHIIEAVEGYIAVDDGSSLRSKSQLLQLKRALNFTHQNMLKAGR